MSWNPAHPVYEQSLRTPERLALAADGEELGYGELVLRARRLGAALRDAGIGRGGYVGILASRSRIAVEALLGVAWSGAAWVPLGLRWPEARLAATLELVDLDAVIADQNGLALLTPPVLAMIERLLLPGVASGSEGLRAAAPALRSLDALPDGRDFPEPAPMSGSDLAYLIFTSGTTGIPKGVMVEAASVSAYLAALGQRKALTCDDRVSQFTELSFDPSLGEILLPLQVGASLHVVPALSTMSPARFIRERRLTVWGSAPAAIAWMRDTRSLAPGSLPSLRYTSFGGEPLALASVQAWQAAAPNSVVDNLYGPTEATVDCAGQRVEPGAVPILTPGRDILAIGHPHPGTELAVFGPDRRARAAGEAGELAIAGSQLSRGYLDAPALTAERFPVIDGKRWYLTGDLALQDASGVFHHLGRIDNQIKISGHRVELEDVEAHLRGAAACDQVAAIAWPIDHGVARGIVGFVAGSALPPARIREALRRRLPSHMVPAAIHRLAALPLGSTGKLDRRALIARLAEEAKAPDESG